MVERGDDGERTRGESPERPPIAKIAPVEFPSTMGKIKQVGRRIGKIQIRDWNEFCLMTRFRWPKKDRSMIMRRVVLNIVYFQANYAIIMLLSLAFLCIAHPLFLFALAQLVGTMWYIHKHRDDETDHAALKHKAVMALSLCALVVAGGNSLISAVVLTLLFTVGHSIGRVPTSKAPNYTWQDLWEKDDSIGALILGPKAKEIDLEDPLASDEGMIATHPKLVAKAKVF